MIITKRICERVFQSGFTLIEALVGSAVLMIGISAAASLSLSLVTQEEINERSVRALNYLDTAAMLVQLGYPPLTIGDFLPDEPVVDSLTALPQNVPLSDSTGSPLGPPMRMIVLTVVYSPNAAVTSNSSSLKEWTGGQSGVTRSHSVRVLVPQQDN